MTLFDGDSAFKQAIAKSTPPAGCCAHRRYFCRVGRSAIAEYAAEKFADKKSGRTTHGLPRARSICAEMHSGFGALRSACPMLNIEAALPQIRCAGHGATNPPCAPIPRHRGMWTAPLGRAQGPMLFGDFSIADAYFAPVCMRLRTCALPVPGRITDYPPRHRALPGVRADRRRAGREALPGLRGTLHGALTGDRHCPQC